MKSKQLKKLRVHVETLRRLTEAEALAAQGGGPLGSTNCTATARCTLSCPCWESRSCLC